MANNTRQLGWASFASVLVVVAGLLQGVLGLTALLNEGFLTAMGGSLVVWDLAAWGWIHLAMGLAAVVVGTSLMGGGLWSRSTAVMLAALNMVALFVFVSVYPLWTVVLLALNLLVMYSLTARAND